jgi:hypothetical protein
MLGRGAPSVLFMHSSSHRDCVGPMRWDVGGCKGGRVRKIGCRTGVESTDIDS